MNTYQRFLLMLAIAFCVVYMVLYLDVDNTDHIFLSMPHFYRTLLIVSPMAILILLMVPKTYTSMKMNNIIMGASGVVFLVSLIFLQNQTFMKDTQYLKAMIPHHSAAIMTSKTVTIKDPRVIKLSQQILHSQEDQLDQMKKLLKEMQQ
ncbi:DUF305 domain-containing protein [Cytophagaceae bacterium BD1B2-1]|uniref:DUF305 domain-containing protein n=2 Tax=Xanthocytophaga agilis TaxID=3048010 RepID=A0AAE3RAE7_9BACT|nr:DUF305 domain-containing protein [Xanthocytophaga agilis]